MPRTGGRKQRYEKKSDARKSEMSPAAKPESARKGALKKLDSLEEDTSSEPPKVASLKQSRQDVKFNDKSDFYQVELADLEEDKRPLVVPKPPALKSLRYFIMIIALISPFVTTYSRTIINFAIIDMIYPEQPTLSPNTDVGQTLINATNTIPAFDQDRSCPVNDEERARLGVESRQAIARGDSTEGEKYRWDTFKQGLLKAAYTIGHAPFQIFGSRLAEIYGARRNIGSGAFIIALCCIMAPYLAAIDFYLLFVDLILLGILVSFMSPALITLFSNWLTPSEKSLMMTFYLAASRLGGAFSFIACGSMFESGYSWRYVFFSAGWISLAYCVIFVVSIRSQPPDHPLIQQAELDYLASKNTLVRERLAEDQGAVDNKEQAFELTIIDGQEQESQKTPQKSSAPWLAILTNVSVWSFIVTKFCVKLAGDTVQTELPTYLNKVMHFSPVTNSLVNACNNVIFCLSCLGVGSLAKYVMKRRPFGLSKTALRKCFQSVGSFGVSLALLGMAFSVCNNIATEICLMMIFFLTTFGTGGEAQIPLDITERYPGTIHAIGSSVAISGAIEPILVGFLMTGHAADKDSWKTVWLGASGIAFFGGLVFLLFADATVQPFDAIGSEKPGDSRTAEEGKTNKAFEGDVATSVEVASSAEPGKQAAGRGQRAKVYRK